MKVVHRLFTMGLVVGLAVTAHARLGETRAQNAKRYGAGKEEVSAFSGAAYTDYQAQGLSISVRYSGEPAAQPASALGHVENEKVTRMGQSAPMKKIETPASARARAESVSCYEMFSSDEKLTKAQIKAILDANLGTWEKVEDEEHDNMVLPTWRSKDGKRVAHLGLPIRHHQKQAGRIVASTPDPAGRVDGKVLIVRSVESPAPAPEGF